MAKWNKWVKFAIGTGAVGGGLLVAASVFGIDNHTKKRFALVDADENLQKRPKRHLPSRDENLHSLARENFDVIVIGGGATGAGCALDAVSRGMKTALVEMEDYSSGTSSRSTKLIHGGVRYLQKAILSLDIEQYKMVKEALHERSNLLEIAPHLSYPFPIMIPIYTWWQLPYYWFGIKVYDILAGSKCIKSSYAIGKEKALELFPMLKRDKLVGALVYYDGQHNDSRMNLSIVLSAIRMGATASNYVKVIGLIHEEHEGKQKLCGARCRDEITHNEFTIRAKCIINATGPFTDNVRRMNKPDQKDICAPSIGIHITLPDYYSPEQMGLLDPNTSDGRVIFFLPWEGRTIAGTTDSPCVVTRNPSPSERDIQFILKEVRNYLNSSIEVRRGDVLSAWAGIRPLVQDPDKEETQSLARNHIVNVSENGLITIAGGKWTTYRAMASDAIDAAIKTCGIQSTHEDCQTDGLLLEGAHGWTPTMYIRLVQDFGMETDIARHLAHTYGDRAFQVAQLASISGARWPLVGKRLHSEFPYIDAEVRYAVREYAVTAVDVIARRLRLSFLNAQAAEEALPSIVAIMAEELKWDKNEKARQLENAKKFLQTEMGQNINRQSRENVPIKLTANEMKEFTQRFNRLDSDRKGFITVNDVRRSFEMRGEHISNAEVHAILNEVDLNLNGQVELEEYLQMVSAIKSGSISHSRFAHLAEMAHQDARNKISVERSGGGI